VEGTAMKAKRTTEITVQTDEAFVIRRGAGSPQLNCERCGAGVPMIAPEEAAVLMGVAVRAIYREVEAGRLHFQDSAFGSVVVCLGSLREMAARLSGNSNTQIKNQKEIQS
jgi:hypothetical protein